MKFNKQTIESILRSLLQVLAFLVTFGIAPETVGVISEFVTFITSNLDSLFSSASTIVGVVLGGYSIFMKLKNPLKVSERWTERADGVAVKAKAAMQGVSVKQYLG